MAEFFRRFARSTSDVLGAAWSFVVAFALILGWALTGQVFRYSDTWQLVINTTTTIITFLMVFLIQNTQNRDSRAIQLKLDELLRGVKGARTGLVQLEGSTEAELDKLGAEFGELRARASARLEQQTLERRASDDRVA
jgi:low affinity Fe/Cu permease